jgi:ubiquinone/menaquinone biosynthesis C-methylase UbiE
MNNNIYTNKQTIFNIWASFYDCFFTTVFYQAVQQRLLEYVQLKDRSQVLDLGCGTGRLLNKLAARFPNLKGIGLDLSREMLRQARRNNQFRERIIFVSGNAVSLPFADNQFEAVFNTISFLHYPDPEQVLQQVSRVLSPGGYFYLVDSCFGDRDITTSVSWLGEMRLYSKTTREKLGKDVGLQCLGHHYLISSILLTIFIKE